MTLLHEHPGGGGSGEGPSVVTWAALLAHCTRFAQSAVGLPREGEGARWRSCVPDVIALHAVRMALADLDSLGAGERELGLDRAGLLVRRHATNIHEAWRGEALPEGLTELVNDAFEAYRRAPESGTEWVAGERGGLGVAPPATWPPEAAAPHMVVFALRVGEGVSAGCPVLFARGVRGGVPPQGAMTALSAWAERMGATGGGRRVPIMRQVYRCATGEVIASLDETLPAGMPLLAEWRGHAGSAQH